MFGWLTRVGLSEHVTTSGAIREETADEIGVRLFSFSFQLQSSFGERCRTSASQCTEIIYRVYVLIVGL